MTKRHFIELADVIRTNREVFSDEAIAELARFCKRQNPQFMAQRWLDYIDGKCGPSGGAVKAVSEPWPPEPRIYRIIRFREHGRRRVIRNNVTLTEAQAHCSREDTHGFNRGSRWFDGYDYMPGYEVRS